MFRSQPELGCVRFSPNSDVQVSAQTWEFKFQPKTGCSGFKPKLAIQVSARAWKFKFQPEPGWSSFPDSVEAHFLGPDSAKAPRLPKELWPWQRCDPNRGWILLHIIFFVFSHPSDFNSMRQLISIITTYNHLYMFNIKHMICIDRWLNNNWKSITHNWNELHLINIDFSMSCSLI